MQAQVWLLLPSVSGFVFKRGKLISNPIQNTTVVFTVFVLSSVNHVCYTITPNFEFEGKSLHTQCHATHE
jgi:hypothetical protein